MTPIIHNIDSIVHGNPGYWDMMLMKEETYLDSLLPDFQKFSPPKNSSPATQSELKMIEEILAEQGDKESSDKEEINTQLIDLFEKLGATEEVRQEISSQVAEEITPLLTKLLYFFNRPRPVQLGFYYRLKIYPKEKYFLNTPSYPAGETLNFFLISEILGNRFPEGYRKMHVIREGFIKAFMQEGIHYSSDHDMAVYVAKKVLEHPEFKFRFRL
jgi:hypothetical protein